MKLNSNATYLFTYSPGPAHQHNKNNPKNNSDSHDYKRDSSYNTGFQQDVLEFAGRCFINQNTLEQRKMKREERLISVRLYIRSFYLSEVLGNNSSTVLYLCFIASWYTFPLRILSSPSAARGIICSAFLKEVVTLNAQFRKAIIWTWSNGMNHQSLSVPWIPESSEGSDPTTAQTVLLLHS